MKKSEILKYLNNAEGYSTCAKRKVGAVLLDNNNRVTFGANGPINSFNKKSKQICKLCSECSISKELCPAIHAEIACITGLNRVPELSLYGVKTLLVSYSPCPECCKAIARVGINQVVVKEPRVKKPDLSIRILHQIETYDDLAEELLKSVDVKYIRLWECDEDCEVI